MMTKPSELSIGTTSSDRYQALSELEKELAAVDARRNELLREIGRLREELASCGPISATAPLKLHISGSSLSAEDRVSVFRELFRGREDVFPRRFESIKTGRSGYQPVCVNEWQPGVCQKPRIKCTACENRVLVSLSDDIVRCHLLGYDPHDPKRRDFTIGVYPLLEDETCWFLAADFDKASWHEDAAAFLATCNQHDVPAALERSRSGNGGHIWVFFSVPIPAVLARKLGAFLLTESMDRRPELGFDSYDRFFPNQDTMPKGGFGNLIALPLQKRPRELGNSVFLDPTSMEPWPDQWGFLASLPRMSRETVEDLVHEAECQGLITGVRSVAFEDETEQQTPWKASHATNRLEDKLPGPLPEKLMLVLGNQIYIAKADLTPPLRNRLLRLAAFQNPEFYKAQAMRMPTYNKPRIICCAEDFPNHIALPRGCMDDALALLDYNGIAHEIIDERNVGKSLDLNFQGQLRPEQQRAADALLGHDIGVLCAATAFGKTVVSAYLLAKRGVNSLILVHRGQLLDQWVERLSMFLGVPKNEIGRIGGGKRKPTGNIDVATIQSLFSRNTVDEIAGQYGHVIVDECHHLSAHSFEAVARQCKAKYVLGLSATVTRQDGHHPIIFMQCGPVRWKVSDREQAAARPFDHHVIVRETEFEPPQAMRESTGWTVQQYYDCLVDDAARNKMIIEDVLDAVNTGRSPVVITERTTHAELLTHTLEEHCPNVIMFKGGLGAKQRRILKDRLDAIPPEAPRILVATGKYLGEGFDDSRLDTLFLALPVSWRGVLAQYAGRLHRLYDGKREVIIYDYADLHVAMLARMFKRRQRGYHAIGYNISEARDPSLTPQNLPAKN